MFIKSISFCPMSVAGLNRKWTIVEVSCSNCVLPIWIKLSEVHMYLSLEISFFEGWLRSGVRGTGLACGKKHTWGRIVVQPIGYFICFW